MSIGLLLANLAATLFMTGLIWFVQVVHYPLFSEVGRVEFSQYSGRHSALTTLVVGPPMLVEAFTAGLLLLYRPPRVPYWLLAAGCLLLAAIWLSTWSLQVPHHQKLAVEFKEDAWRRLVSTNWIRTIGWTARSMLMSYAIWLTILAE